MTFIFFGIVSYNMLQSIIASQPIEHYYPTNKPFLLSLFYFCKVVRGSLTRVPLQPARRPDIEVASRPLNYFRAHLCFVSSHATSFATD